MRILMAGVLALVAAGTVVAIDTEFVPYDSIQGEHWTFDVRARLPQRVTTVDAEGQEQAYWAIIYTVTNPDKVAHDFLPDAVMFTDAGRVAHDSLYPVVVADLKARYRLNELNNTVEMMGPLKAGEDEAKDAVFVFPEVDPQMDHFKVFITGLSGEFIVKTIPAASQDEEPKNIVLRKTLELVYKFPGDDINLNADKVYLVSQKWIWR